MTRSIKRYKHIILIGCKKSNLNALTSFTME